MLIRLTRRVTSLLLDFCASRPRLLPVHAADCCPGACRLSLPRLFELALAQILGAVLSLQIVKAYWDFYDMADTKERIINCVSDTPSHITVGLLFLIEFFGTGFRTFVGLTKWTSNEHVDTFGKCLVFTLFSGEGSYLCTVPYFKIECRGVATCISLRGRLH